MSLADTGEVDGELALMVSVLVEHQDQVVVSPALGQQLDLRAQLDVFTPNILKNEMSCLVLCFSKSQSKHNVTQP